MNRQNSRPTEVIAGAIGIFAVIAECESFSYLHMAMGLTLTLYIGEGIRRSRRFYEAVVYWAAVSGTVLLTLSKLIDWIRDKWLRDELARDASFALVWVLLVVIGVLIIERVVARPRKRGGE